MLTFVDVVVKQHYGNQSEKLVELGVKSFRSAPRSLRPDERSFRHGRSSLRLEKRSFRLDKSSLRLEKRSFRRERVTE